MGCNKGYDLSGEQFGRLTVVLDTGDRDPKRGKIWLCDCVCGNEKKASTSHLKAGNVRSCGCLVAKHSRRKRVAEPKNKSITYQVVDRVKVMKELADQVPEGLEGLRHAVTDDYYFQVFENGDIFRINQYGEKEKAPYHKANGYTLVTTTINRKQYSRNVHRLLAEAFIPNPENKNRVVFLDNDKNNLSLDNLVWMTQAELTEMNNVMGYRDPYKHAVTCPSCNEKTLSKTGMCLECREKKKSLELFEVEKQKRIDSVAYQMEHLDLLTNRQKEYILLRSKGLNMSEIGRKLGVTRQAVENAIKNSIQRIEKQLTKIKQEKAITKKNIEKIPERHRVIVESRLKHELSRKDMADLLGMTERTYGAKEVGESNFDIPEALILSDLFGKSLDVLFSNDISSDKVS